MSVPKIENLEELIGGHIDGKKKIVDTKITRLTAPGENYGSEMLRVDMVLKDEENDEKEDLNVVAKLIPESEFYRIIFNVETTFRNEKEFYTTIVPCLQQFQRKQGVGDVIRFFPKYHGARYNLENSDLKIDGNAVLVLENLKVKGYDNVNRQIGFDLPTTKLILTDIAKLHAVPLALKLKDPHTFDKKLKPYLLVFQPEYIKPKADEMNSMIITFLKDSRTCRQFVPQVAKSFQHFDKLPKTFREPFSTMIHRDLWVNNIMLKFENGKAVDSKFVDFQSYSYDTPVMDLFFFLFTSVKRNIIQENLDHFLEYYHKVFVDTLESLGCDTTPFSYQQFLEEMAACVERELAHTIFMSTFVVLGTNGSPSPADDPSKPPSMEGVEIPDENKEKTFWILQECCNRGWLNF